MPNWNTALWIVAASVLATAAVPPDELATTSIAVDGRWAGADDVDRLVAPYRAEVEREIRRVLARAPQTIESGKPEGPLGNLLADAMLDAALEATGARVDIAFSNSGGIRNIIPAGDVTVGTVFEVMPFDNTIVVFDLPGTALKSMLDSMAARGGDPIAGVRYVIRRGHAVQITLKGKPLDEKTIYRVATSDYVFDGGGRYAGMHAASRIVRTNVMIRDALMAKISALAGPGGVLTLSGDGRIRGEVAK
ncbi:MAG: 5'-nucleotidase C-terminal domain-containing protein [Deltaproteobacteria bacterium]|nr:5'-nucleotidase C-terminal domain-containing protein [Deltaproteobacteria bacterium]